MVVHTVFFWLKPELTPKQRADFDRGVESMRAIKSIAEYYPGTPAGSPRRPTVDHSFDVAITMLFRNLDDLNSFQVDPIHERFIETFKSYRTRIQIYDSE